MTIAERPQRKGHTFMISTVHCDFEPGFPTPVWVATPGGGH